MKLRDLFRKKEKEIIIEEVKEDIQQPTKGTFPEYDIFDRKIDLRTFAEKYGDESDIEAERIERSESAPVNVPQYSTNKSSENKETQEQPEPIGDVDELFHNAVQFCIDTGKASTSLIQRRFQIGYNRAANLIDELEENGVIGPADGSNPRKILISDLSDIGTIVETVVSLYHQKRKYIDIEVNVEEMEPTGSELRHLATYDEIKKYCLEKHGVKVTTLYITQVKHKMGLPMRPNYNISKNESYKQPQCPPEKEEVIIEALKHFKMI